MNKVPATITASRPLARMCTPRTRISIRHGSEGTGGFIRHPHPMLPMFEDRIIHSHLLEGSYESVGIEYFALHAVLPDVALLRKKPFVDELLQASLHCPGSDVHTLRKCRDARKRQS